MADEIAAEEDNTPIEKEEGGSYLEAEESVDADAVGPFDPILNSKAWF